MTTRKQEIQIAHDYPLMESELVSIINELIPKNISLVEIYNNLKAVVKDL